jgi:phosphoribosylaminoimidazolecarboxamide formyltransferase / IMP cyclohydrolase
MSDVRPIRRALLAVYDKSGVVELARALVDLGVSLVSSGGTASTIADAGLPVAPVEDVTGFPELLGGRVKTLHPRIHAGLLADRRNQAHVDELAEHGIEPFDLVVVNLYPFRETVASGAAFDEVIEKIDIGGPAMARAAAKNFESVGVVVRPDRYEMVLDEVRLEGGLTRATRLALAAEAFAHTAAYDAAVAGWYAEQAAGSPEELPGFAGLALEKVTDLRYGENPHQRGALYATAGGPGALGGAVVIQGKEMSFNNWLDAVAAYDLASALPQGACVIVKHNNPCGVAARASSADSYRDAYECDPLSAYGSVVAFNEACDLDAAEATRVVFTEIVMAPSFSDHALDSFRERKNLRVVQAPIEQPSAFDIRTIPGGALVQDPDVLSEGRSMMSVASTRSPTEDEWRDLLLAWIIGWRAKSNAITFVRDGALVGIGTGHVSRVDAVWTAVRKAGDKAKGAVMASEALIPFPDAVEVAADAGIVAVIQPGGALRDDEVLSAAEARGMAVVVTGRRHFRH